MPICLVYKSQLYISRYTTMAKVKNESFCQTRKKNIRIKFYLFCRTHALEHHRYIVEFYITKLSIQCSLPMWCAGVFFNYWYVYYKLFVIFRLLKIIFLIGRMSSHSLSTSPELDINHIRPKWRPWQLTNTARIWV